jgi:lysyl-tRNA synthetase, class I
MDVPVTGGQCKLQWKPDFGARWAALGVDFEMYGKDHSTNTPIYDAICEILGAPAPEHFTYELFLDENGQKISKSSGNGISIDEWLSYAATESLSYFMYQKPKTAKRLFFDVIPKAVDEYHQQLRAYPDQDIAQKLANPVYHIHSGEVPASTMIVSFAMLLNLASWPMPRTRRRSGASSAATRPKQAPGRIPISTRRRASPCAISTIS